MCLYVTFKHAKNDLILSTECEETTVLKMPMYCVGQQCPRGGASVLLAEGCWFDTPGLHVECAWARY